jgi:membrane protein implicated in regulation of membrane protease activity
MPRRTLVELLHLLFGILATVVLASLASWSVPNARDSIALVAWVVVAVVVVMGIQPLRRAWVRDHRPPAVTVERTSGE